MADKLREQFYHRRIDRSPEKSEFERLPGDDKNFISGLRSAVGNTREKFSRMQDELDAK